MVMIKTHYNPNSPRDVTDFIIVVCKLYKDPNNGPSRAKRALEEVLNRGTEGQQLLRNCYIDFCRQISVGPWIQDKDKLATFQSLASITKGLSKFAIEWTY